MKRSTDQRPVPPLRFELRIMSGLALLGLFGIGLSTLLHHQLGLPIVATYLVAVVVMTIGAGVVRRWAGEP